VALHACGSTCADVRNVNSSSISVSERKREEGKDFEQTQGASQTLIKSVEELWKA